MSAFQWIPLGMWFAPYYPLDTYVLTTWSCRHKARGWYAASDFGNKPSYGIGEGSKLTKYKLLKS
jgi:hypothetical protein